MHDNKGFSLIELIIVMAITAILLGVTWYGFNTLTGKQVRECVDNLETYLGKTRAYTLAFAEGAVEMEFSHTADGYFVTTRQNGAVEDSRKIGNPSLLVDYYTNSGAKVEMSVGVTLSLSFKRDSGAFQTLPGGGYCNRIEVRKGDRKISLVLVPATGKYYTE